MSKNYKLDILTRSCDIWQIKTTTNMQHLIQIENKKTK